ncbi:11269_t:CDS:2 [Gigaspora margarita]|uniref:11269_t:CDS:1 n=1 Tax=Gigaspora margarita TaxID=4874 RepID=A0ABN7URT2_GIGMA|nr:11269_t:CDS:2 [Gigaspora margarita]
MTVPHDLCARIQNGFRAKLASIAVPESKMSLSIVKILYEQGFISSVQRGNHIKPDEVFTPTVPTNIATRRLWLDLKYRDNEPVLKYMQCVSKGSKRIYMNVQELMDLASGKRAKFVPPLKPGEIAIVSTSKGVLEIKDALESQIPLERGCYNDPQSLLQVIDSNQPIRSHWKSLDITWNMKKSSQSLEATILPIPFKYSDLPVPVIPRL